MDELAIQAVDIRLYLKSVESLHRLMKTIDE